MDTYTRDAVSTQIFGNYEYIHSNMKEKIKNNEYYYIK